MKDISGKVRMLKVLEILETETDEKHRLSLNEIKEKLRLEFGDDYSVGKKALVSDLKSLQEAGYDIVETEEKFGQKKYSYPYRMFEIHELRMLTDAVMFSHFITKEDARALIKKLQKQTSKHNGKKIQDQSKYVDYLVRADNKQLKYYVDTIYSALSDHKMIRFKYGNYNLNKNFELKKSGEWYEVKPYALVWWQDNYYLVAEYGKEEELRHYRVDRMRKVEELDISFQKKPFDLADHVKKAFHMFRGEEKQIKLQFEDHNNTFITIVLDHFGKDVLIQKQDEQHFVLTTQAQMSQGLINWILTWGSKVKVLAPQELIDDVKTEAEKMARLYDEMSV